MLHPALARRWFHHDDTGQTYGWSWASHSGGACYRSGTMEEKVDAIKRPVADRARHAVTALAIAREYVDFDRVLNRLIDQAACHG